MKDRGLYETLITQALESRLRALGQRLVADRKALRAAEAGDRIALHLSRIIQRAIDTVDDTKRVDAGIALAGRLVREIDRALNDVGAAPEAPVEPGTVLHAVTLVQPDGTPRKISEPLIPLLDTTLLTNSPGEPRVGKQLLTEIDSADRVDVVMAFIRRSGIVPLLEAIRRHCQDRPLRVLTTTYTGSTELEALEALQEAGAEVRVSYDQGSTRLHAKAWLFHRQSGFSTAYIGSSNLTHSAQVSGLEWNVRVSGARNADVLQKVEAVFESYWHSGDFIPFVREEFLARLPPAPGDVRPFVSPVHVRAEPFQARLLEQVELARQAGHHRNLIAAATGTGKTVMAALDYKRLRATLPRARLLFVAHREELLRQSLATFCQALGDRSFGELWVGRHRPRDFEHVFASIQNLSAARLRHLDPKHFDVVIVDEFHHAAAPTYDRLLNHVQPRELLGLTATPERTDGAPILHWFDDRIAAELRLWDAIDQHRLTPFVYYGVHDGLDLRQVPWVRGRGYDVQGLSNLLTANDVWAGTVLSQVRHRVGDPTRMKALGFCVSVAHARFMARVFAEAGVPSVAVTSGTPEAEREAALRDLEAGAINVVFSVDLFNEGVDVPALDTLLLLRPTDSGTLFLQQLGRGLRRSDGKSVCVVLDFVGRHRREFRFDRRLRALIGGSRRDLERQVDSGFPFLPAGCHMELDQKASQIVLDSIRRAVPANWTQKSVELRRLAQSRGAVSLPTYLEETGQELEDVYAGNRSWSDLRAHAGLPTLAGGPHEAALRRACGRLLHVDDVERIEAWRSLLSGPAELSPARLPERSRRLLRMLVASVADQALPRAASLEDGQRLLYAHPQVRAELLELMDVLAGRLAHVPSPLARFPEVPLQIHARYSRLEILAAFGIGDGARIAPWQTGVYWASAVPADLLAFTLDKTSGQFSPTTRYRDYAISRDLIHWQSQSVTRADGQTGRRYRHHERESSAVMLFARERASDRAFYFLGPARYLDHHGEQPMSITWALNHPLPGDLYAAFAAAVA